MLRCAARCTWAPPPPFPSPDFQVVRGDDFIDGYVSPLTDLGGKGRGGAFLNRGGHYTDTATERAWRAQHQHQ